MKNNIKKLKKHSKTFKFDDSLTFIDLFSGIGGMRLGLEQAGFTCLMSSEINHHARLTYQTNFGEEPRGDIKQIPSDEIPNHNVLVGGFPCQSHSLAGKRDGLIDPRGDLIFEIQRILRDKKPDMFLLENVKGLLSSNNGRAFKLIINELKLLGYQVYWKVLNSKDFGVAQSRERIYIVGTFSSTPFVFPEPYGKQVTLEQILESEVDRRFNCSSAYVNYLLRRQNNNQHSFGYKIRNGCDISGTLLTSLSCLDRNIIPIFPIGYEGNAPKTIEECQRLGISFRKLTPVEFKRLQGFPEHFLVPQSNAQAYKQFGNSVSVPVIKEIAYAIRMHLEEDSIHQFNQSLKSSA